MDEGGQEQIKPLKLKLEAERFDRNACQQCGYQKLEARLLPTSLAGYNIVQQTGLGVIQTFFITNKLMFILSFSKSSKLDCF